MAGQIDSVSCSVCGDRTTFLFVQQGFEVWGCCHCGFLRMVAGKEAPATVDYARLYGDNYYGRGDHSSETISRYRLDDILDSKLPQALASIRLLKRFKSGGRLLDVGCSAGVFVKAAGEAGFDATGIDVSVVAVDFARNQLGVDAHTATVESAEFDDGRFDVITLWDVLEHFEDPWAAMRRIDRWLAPGGILGLRTPNTRCLRTVLQGFRGWGMISPPEHYHLFSRKSLGLFLGQVGYHIAVMSTVHSDWIYYRRRQALARMPFGISGALGLGGDLVAVAERTT